MFLFRECRLTQVNEKALKTLKEEYNSLCFRKKWSIGSLCIIETLNSQDMATVEYTYLFWIYGKGKDGKKQEDLKYVLQAESVIEVIYFIWR